MVQRGIIPTLVLCLSIILPCTARAESIAIDSGFMRNVFSSPFPAETAYSLQGTGFSISGGGADLSPLFHVGSIGAPFNLSATLPVTSNPSFCFVCGLLGIPTQVQLNGTVFNEPSVIYGGHFNFSALIPAVGVDPSPTGLSPFTFSQSVPFAFTGDVVGLNAVTHLPVFDVTLTGGGMVTTSFAQLGPSFVEARNIRFDFAPVPEPNAIVLFASGLGLLCLWFGRQRWNRRTWLSH